MNLQRREEIKVIAECPNDRHWAQEMRRAVAELLAHLAAQPDWTCRYLAEALSGLADGANDLGETIAHLRTTLGGSEADLAAEEAAYRWREWIKSEQAELASEFAEVLRENLSDLYA